MQVAFSCRGCGIDRNLFERINREFSIAVVLVPDFDLVASEFKLAIKVNHTKLVAFVERPYNRRQRPGVSELEFVDDVTVGEGDNDASWILSQQHAGDAGRIRRFEYVVGHGVISNYEQSIQVTERHG